MEKWSNEEKKGRWTAYRHPFFHLHAINVFPLETYDRLSAEFAAILKPSLNGINGVGPKMVKSHPDYDALILAMNAQLSGGFAPIFTREWIYHLAQLLGLSVTLRIDGDFITFLEAADPAGCILISAPPGLTPKSPKKMG